MEDTGGEVVVAVLDGNVLDYLLDTPGALGVVQAAQRAGRLRLLRTHVMRDELGGMPVTKGDRWAQLREIEAALTFEDVPMAGFVLDLSRLDRAAPFDDTSEYETLTKGNPRDAKDALLSLTAQNNGAVLVTDDGSMGRRARARAIPAMRPAELVAMLNVT